MKQLVIEDIFNMTNDLMTKKKMNFKDIMQLPIYLGDDEELNGVHTGWFCQLIDSKDRENADLIEMINDDYGNIKITDKGVLIS